MTSSSEQPQRTLSRRETRELVERAGFVERPAGRQWSAKRIVGTALSGLGALGLVGAFLAPTAAAIAEQGGGETSAFQTSLSQAQTYAASEEVEQPLALHTGAYEVYVKPKPKPKPKPEPETASVDSGDDGGGSAAPPGYTGGGSKEEWMTAAGISQGDWGYVDYIATRESGWNPNATNPSSGACGVIQALPCSKVPGSGYDPVDNLRWANGYAISRYGSWASAYAFWTANHWW